MLNAAQEYQELPSGHTLIRYDSSKAVMIINTYRTRLGLYDEQSALYSASSQPNVRCAHECYFRMVFKLFFWRVMPIAFTHKHTRHVNSLHTHKQHKHTQLCKEAEVSINGTCIKNV